MSLRTSLQRLTRRDPDAPSLRERAASLRGGLARVARRAEPPTDQQHEPIAAPLPDAIDWEAWAAHHPGFMPVPANKPTALMALDAAIPQEARRLLDLAEAEFERRRQAYVGYHDATVWPRVAAGLRREMRMDALAAAATPTADEAAPELDPVHALIAEHRVAYADWDRTSAVWNDMLLDDPDFETARAASDEPRERESATMEALITARPTTLAGVQALAEYLPGAIRRVNTHHEESDGERALKSIAAALSAMPPPPDTLSTRLLALWSAWAATEGTNGIPEDGAAWEDMDQRRRALLDAAEALPATWEAIIPKALALAWIEYVDLWERGRKREQYATNGRLALDIHAAATAGAQAAPASPPDINLVDRLDLATATMGELQALNDVAGLVSGVAYAVTWQRRCKARGPGDLYNVAGTLMQDLADALTDVEGAAVREARRRTSASGNDRETRLRLIALPIIQNGEPTEVATLARELTAHATAAWGAR